MGVNRVTAGIPGLLPNQRASRDVVEKTRHDDALRLVDELQRNEVIDDGVIDRTNLMAQMGRGMHSSKVIAKLKTLNPALIFELALRDPQRMGIYAELPEKLPTGGVVHRKTFITGMMAEFMPEFTVIHVKEVKIPDPKLDGTWKTVKQPVDMTKGWRTILIQLANIKLINLMQAEKEFDILAGRSSELWQKSIN